MTEKRCGFSYEAHDLKVAGSNPASVKGLLRMGCVQGEDGKKRRTIYTVFTNLICYFRQRRDAVFLMRLMISRSQVRILPLSRVCCAWAARGKKRCSISTVYHALTGIIGYFWQRRDAVFLMRLILFKIAGSIPASVKGLLRTGRG